MGKKKVEKGHVRKISFRNSEVDRRLLVNFCRLPLKKSKEFYFEYFSENIKIPCQDISSQSLVSIESACILWVPVLANLSHCSCPVLNETSCSIYAPYSRWSPHTSSCVMSLRPVSVALRCIMAVGFCECIRPSAWPISWAATCTRSVSQTPDQRTITHKHSCKVKITFL